MSPSSFFSSFLNVVHGDAQEEPEAVEANSEEAPPASSEVEEPEDLHPTIRKECEMATCASLTKHFEHCQEKVSSGHGYKGEDCVEELMMHCADACAAPKLFSKLK